MDGALVSAASSSDRRDDQTPESCGNISSHQTSGHQTVLTWSWWTTRSAARCKNGCIVQKTKFKDYENALWTDGISWIALGIIRPIDRAAAQIPERRCRESEFGALYTRELQERLSVRRSCSSRVRRSSPNSLSRRRWPHSDVHALRSLEPSVTVTLSSDKMRAAQKLLLWSQPWSPV